MDVANAIGVAMAGEREAEEFAEELLMPEHMIRAMGPQGRTVAEMAMVFLVPEQEMLKRLWRLGYSL